MAFYIYILSCIDNSYYVGHTDNIDQRISEHNIGLYSGYTSTRLPIKVLHVQEFGTRDEAIIAERQIKGWNRKKKEALINGDWETIKLLSNKKSN